MVIGLRDGAKLFGIAIVCFCAAFVCTFMLNFYLDVLPLRDTFLQPELLALYEAQVAMAKFTAAITGGVLGLTAFCMLLFYMKIYVDEHARALGVLKALGYGRARLASGFWVFGLSVFLGCTLGFACGWAIMPFVYRAMTIDGASAVPMHFHAGLLFAIVLAPTLVLTALACLYPYAILKTNPNSLMKGIKNETAAKERKSKKERSFRTETCLAVLRSKKSLAFLAAFSCFCFSAMTQMGLSMENLNTGAMGYVILAIGLTLAVTTAVMTATALVNSNAKNIAMMKAFGYPLKDCALCVLGGYLPFAVLGFALGTLYQYGLLVFMVNVVFSNVSEMPDYSFDVGAFFLTLALFLVCYAVLIVSYVVKINRVSVKEVMNDN